MILRDLLKEIYYYKIKKMSKMEYRIFHLRRTGMKIGDDCWIFSDDVETGEPYLVSIGDHTMISPRVMFSTHDTSIHYYLPEASDIFGRITVGSSVYIGMGAIILPGVTIADGCIIGAGSIVTKNCEVPNGVYVGSPARFVCYTDDLKEKNKKYALNVWDCKMDKKEYLLAHEDKFKGYRS